MAGPRAAGEGRFADIARFVPWPPEEASRVKERQDAGVILHHEGEARILSEGANENSRLLGRRRGKREGELRRRGEAEEGKID